MWTALIPVLFFVGEFAAKLAVIAFILVRRRRKPSVNLAWTVVILLLPIVGIAAYLLFGEVRLGGRRSRHYDEIVQRLDVVRLTNQTAEMARVVADVPQRYRQIAHLAEVVGENVPHGGNDLVLLNDTDEFMQAVLNDIQAARDHCHILMYIFLPDGNGHRIAEAMLAAAGRGVMCRLLVDSVGSRRFLKSKLCRRLKQGGVHVVEALPARLLRAFFKRLDLRNHRKIVVIDNAIAYTGSQNIADAEFAPKKRYAPWIDMMVRIDGPVARDLQAIFVQDWFMDTEEPLDDLLTQPLKVHHPGAAAQIIASGPASYTDALRQLTHTTLYAAREELILTTPYFVPDDASNIALQTAARRGVHTTLIVPRRNDSRLVGAASRSHYDVLLESGVRILEYTEGLLHAKTTTIDRDLAIVSTANFDRRSFEINFELSLIVYDTDFASQLRRLQMHYAQRSTPVKLETWVRRPWPQKLAQNAAGTLSPLL